MLEYLQTLNQENDWKLLAVIAVARCAVLVVVAHYVAPMLPTPVRVAARPPSWRPSAWRLATWRPATWRPDAGDAAHAADGAASGGLRLPP